MKAVYMAIIILASAMAIGQYSNADTLEDYYAQYADKVLEVKSGKVEKRANGGWDIYPYGDKNVGYYSTEEQYKNMADPAITGVE